MIDSYLDYARDTSLAKYGADTVGKYINQASKEQVKAINQLGQAIGRGMNVLSNQMSDINETLVFLNRNMDVQIEQQKLSNLLLQNIAELLRVPDSEKERQHSIELGIKFFVNASKDADLYTDALEELLKAESLMKQDYFVLHRIGFIYLYVEKYINPEKALEYFLRAAKYASVESDSKAARLANVLTNNFNTVNSDINNCEKQIGLLAADSYEKAAFCSYIIGRFEDAVSYQIKALKHNNLPQNKFLLAKYQIRTNQISDAVNNLNECIEEAPILALAIFKEIDLFNEPAVVNLVSQKNENVNEKIKRLKEKWITIDSVESKKIILDLKKLLSQSYEVKITEIDKYEIKGKNINNKIKDLRKKIDLLIGRTKEVVLINISNEKNNSIINELENAKELPFEKMLVSYNNIKQEIENNELKIGTKSFGGIVFYIDISNGYGLVCSGVIGKEIWGVNGQFGTSKKFDSGQSNTRKIVDLASIKQEKSFFKTTNIPIDTAAKICVNCKIGGFDDWYLPSTEELTLAYKSVKKYGVLGKKNLWSSTESYYLSKEMTNFGRSEVVVGYIYAMSLDPNTGEIRKTYVDNKRHEKNNFVAIRKFLIPMSY
jgi:tetratricopeptide (TPR) repeat protein